MKVLSLLLLFCIHSIFADYEPRTIETVYGSYEVTEPVLLDLLDNDMVQRLKKINQYGTRVYVKEMSEYNRYQHSVGVMLILRRFGASLQEQVAGLLHDVSHTVFSHVSDYLFSPEDLSNAYQDGIHEWFLLTTSIAACLHKHGYTVADIFHKQDSFLRLEQKLPDLCADRIEYLLYGGFIEGLITQEDIHEIIDDLSFENGVWCFSNVSSARKFSEVSLFLTENEFASPWGVAVYELSAQAMFRAVEIGLITFDEVHFSTDDIVWKKLVNSDDTQLQALISALLYKSDFFEEVVKDQSYDVCKVCKFRGVDPFILTGEGLQRLTVIDPVYAQKFDCLQQKIQAGCYLKLHV